MPTPSVGKKPTVEKGVDVSYWQGKNINWSKAKKAGYSHAMLRASYTGQGNFSLNDDSTFKINVNEASAVGMKIGAYHYSQAVTVAEAQKEAKYLVERCKPYKSKITDPLVIDWEFGGRLNAQRAKVNGKNKNTEMMEAFCEIIKKAGYTPMIYANLSTFKNYLDYSRLKKKYKIWLAQYSSTPGYSDMDWWQYSSTTSVDGIGSKVDVNKIYK